MGFSSGSKSWGRNLTRPLTFSVEPTL
jgi:hypothetical protein